jgi:hypothetical protein
MDESIVKFGEHMTEIALGRPILRRNRSMEGEHAVERPYLDLECPLMRHSGAERFKEIKDGRLELFIGFAVDHGNALVTHDPLEVVRTPWNLHCMLEIGYDNWFTASPRALEKRIIEVFGRYLYGCSAD